MNIIHWNYIKITTIYQNFIEIKWLVDFKKDLKSVIISGAIGLIT